MGSSPEANLAYGYDLGGVDDFKCAERGEYGGPAPSWFVDAEDDEDDEPGFVEQAFNRLYAAIPDAAPAQWDWQRQKIAEQHFGVTFDHSGSHDYPGWVLVAEDSRHSVQWAETMELDLPAMAEQVAGSGWDDKLAAVLKVLGLTPKQDGPKWLVFPFYG